MGRESLFISKNVRGEDSLNVQGKVSPLESKKGLNLLR